MACVTRNPSHLRPPIRRRLLLLGAINRSIAFLPRKSTVWEAVAAQEEALPEMADLHTEPRILPHQMHGIVGQKDSHTKKRDRRCQDKDTDQSAPQASFFHSRLPTKKAI